MVDKGLRSKFALALGICRTCLYRKYNRQAKRDAADIKKIKALHLQEPYYGVERLAIALGWSEKKTRRIRDLAGIKVKRRKKQTRKPRKPEIMAPDNLLREHYALIDDTHPEKGYTFEALTDPDLRVWVQDFTYLKWNGRSYYLAGVKELATRRIVGWCLSLHHDADMVCSALESALEQYPAPAILHDDRGSEYLSFKHAELCDKHHIAMSASAAGKPPENGFMESFFSSFKTEMLDVIQHCMSETELHECIGAWICYYNKIRIHTALRMTPESYARTLWNKLSLVVT